jgi:hypothetical protein
VEAQGSGGYVRLRKGRTAHEMDKVGHQAVMGWAVAIRGPRRLQLRVLGPFKTGYTDTARIHILGVSAKYPIRIRIRNAKRHQTGVSVFHNFSFLSS